MAAVDILKEIAPEFASETPERLDLFISLTDCQISADIFDCDYDLATAYLAAHMLSLAERNAAGKGSNGLLGNIAAKREGDLSISYSLPEAFQMGGDDATYQTTSYGVEFLRLKKMSVICPRTIYDCSR